MEWLLKGISNAAPAAVSKPANHAAKTFSRRLKADAEALATPDPTTTPSSDDELSIDTTRFPKHDGSPARSTAGWRPSTSARRSSLLPAAALLGSSVCKEALGTRVKGCTAGVSKARKKAYQDHITFWAEHFAEVDEFELLEESPLARPPAAETQGRAVGAPGGPCNALCGAGQEWVPEPCQGAADRRGGALAACTPSPAGGVQAAGERAVQMPSEAGTPQAPTAAASGAGAWESSTPCSNSPHSAAPTGGGWSCAGRGLALDMDTTLRARGGRRAADAPGATVTCSAATPTSPSQAPHSLASGTPDSAAGANAASFPPTSVTGCSLASTTPDSTVRACRTRSDSQPCSPGSRLRVQAARDAGGRASHPVSASDEPRPQRLQPAVAQHPRRGQQGGLEEQSGGGGAGGVSSSSGGSATQAWVKGLRPAAEPLPRLQSAAYAEAASSQAVRGLGGLELRGQGTAAGDGGSSLAAAANSSASGTRAPPDCGPGSSARQAAHVVPEGVHTQQAHGAGPSGPPRHVARRLAPPQQPSAPPAAARPKRGAARQPPPATAGGDANATSSAASGCQAPAAVASMAVAEPAGPQPAVTTRTDSSPSSRPCRGGAPAESAGSAQLPAGRERAVGADPGPAAGSPGDDIKASTDQLAQQLAGVQLDAQLTPLQQLLRVCSQEPNEAAIPSMAGLLASLSCGQRVVKVGEGSFGEAFRAGATVFKVAPIEGEAAYNGAAQKRAGEMASEVAIALALSRLRQREDGGGEPHASATSAFVEVVAAGVCRGPHPKPLLRAWDDWDKRRGSENDAPGALAPGQLYVVLAMADGGRDLESAVLAGYRQGVAALLQVALALAVAEDALAFEHRDLHWGNVLLQPASARTVYFRLRGVDVAADTCGVIATLIDFTASRLQTPSGDLVFCDLEADPELFQGPKGDCQAGTYRRMRAALRRDWSASAPVTNAMWLSYLAHVLLELKEMPGVTAAERRGLREFKRRALAYGSAGEAVWDPLFSGLWAAMPQQAAAAARGR